MNPHRIVPRQQWISARRGLLAKEKEFLRLRDELSSERRELPWERVEKSYGFEGRAGKLTLGDLFAGRQQLIVYHFMFAPAWEAGCRGWKFPMVSHCGTTFAEDMGYRSENGRWRPGISVFRRDAQRIVRMSDAAWAPGDDFCTLYHLFDLLPNGAAGWSRKLDYR